MEVNILSFVTQSFSLAYYLHFHFFLHVYTQGIFPIPGIIKHLCYEFLLFTSFFPSIDQNLNLKSYEATYCFENWGLSKKNARHLQRFVLTSRNEPEIGSL